jgi:hypothetical protein
MRWYFIKGETNVLKGYRGLRLGARIRVVFKISASVLRINGEANV